MENKGNCTAEKSLKLIFSLVIVPLLLTGCGGGSPQEPAFSAANPITSSGFENSGNITSSGGEIDNPDLNPLSGAEEIREPQILFHLHNVLQDGRLTRNLEFTQQRSYKLVFFPSQLGGFVDPDVVSEYQFNWQLTADAATDNPLLVPQAHGAEIVFPYIGEKEVHYELAVEIVGPNDYLSVNVYSLNVQSPYACPDCTDKDISLLGQTKIDVVTNLSTIKNRDNDSFYSMDKINHRIVQIDKVSLEEIQSFSLSDVPVMMMYNDNSNKLYVAFKGTITPGSGYLDTEETVMVEIDTDSGTQNEVIVAGRIWDIFPSEQGGALVRAGQELGYFHFYHVLNEVVVRTNFPEKVADDPLFLKYRLDETSNTIYESDDTVSSISAYKIDKNMNFTLISALDLFDPPLAQPPIIPEEYLPLGFSNVEEYLAANNEESDHLSIIKSVQVGQDAFVISLEPFRSQTVYDVYELALDDLSDVKRSYSIEASPIFSNIELIEMDGVDRHAYVANNVIYIFDSETSRKLLQLQFPDCDHRKDIEIIFEQDNSNASVLLEDCRVNTLTGSYISYFYRIPIPDHIR